MIDALAAARAIEADTVALRHDLHRHPEPGMDLPGTQERVLAALGCRWRSPSGSR